MNKRFCVVISKTWVYNGGAFAIGSGTNENGKDVTVNGTVNVTEELKAKYPEIEIIIQAPELSTQEIAARINYVNHGYNAPT